MDGGTIEPPAQDRGRLRWCALVALFMLLILVGAFVVWRVHIRSRVRAEPEVIRQAG